MKTVLLIAYYYPPVLNTAARRPGCMAKYLPEFGWRPLVVTREWAPGNCHYDQNVVRNLPDNTVVAAVPHSGDHAHPGLWENVPRFLCPRSYPLAWTRGVLAILPDIYARERFDAVWATYHPYSALHIAVECRRRFSTPWVADFRDVLGQLGDSEDLVARVRRHRYVPVEKRLVRTAAAITAVNDGQAEILRQRHGRDVTVIPNGFDPDDYAAGPVPGDGKFVILHAGTLYAHRDPRPLFEALAMLLRRGDVGAGDVSVRFYGGNIAPAVEAARACLPPGIMEGHAPVPHAEMIRLEQSASVLLLLACGGSKGVTPGKLLEYVGARRPILAVPNDHASVDAQLRETGAGVSCSTPDEIAAQLLEWYREWKQTGTVACRADEGAIATYSRKRQATQLADVLNAIVGQRA